MRKEPATAKQLDVLAQILPEEHLWKLASLTKIEANSLIKQNKDAWDDLAPTAGQQAYLRKLCLWETGMTRGEADAIINKIKPWWRSY